jgi:hypothetical protein
MDVRRVVARVIVILIKGAPGDCISITPRVLGNMIGDGAVREALRLLHALYIHGILDRVNGSYTLCLEDNPRLWATVKRLPIDEAVAWLLWLIEDALDGKPINTGPSFEL